MSRSRRNERLIGIAQVAQKNETQLAEAITSSSETQRARAARIKEIDIEFSNLHTVKAIIDKATSWTEGLPKNQLNLYGRLSV